MQVNYYQYKRLLFNNQSAISKLLAALLSTTDWNENCKNNLSLTQIKNRMKNLIKKVVAVKGIYIRNKILT